MQKEGQTIHTHAHAHDRSSYKGEEKDERRHSITVAKKEEPAQPQCYARTSKFPDVVRYFTPLYGL